MNVVNAYVIKGNFIFIILASHDILLVSALHNMVSFFNVGEAFKIYYNLE